MISGKLREANEEISLPLNCPHVHVLRILPPFPSLYSLVVTPVVSILSDISILAQLAPNPGEVDDIFDHPLEVWRNLFRLMDFFCLRPAKAFLDPSIMKDEPNLSPRGSENWPYPEELYVSFHVCINSGPHTEMCTRSTRTSTPHLKASMPIETTVSGQHPWLSKASRPRSWLVMVHILVISLGLLLWCLDLCSRSST